MTVVETVKGRSVWIAIVCGTTMVLATMFTENPEETIRTYDVFIWAVFAYAGIRQAVKMKSHI